jgi:Dihydrodipicolinate synthase/N-acetylneuraminate lyase
MENIFKGCIPALMTPCNQVLSPNFDLLVKKADELMNYGISAVIYCGSMGDCPLLSDEERPEGFFRLVKAGIPTIVGPGSINSKKAPGPAVPAQEVGALVLMVIPRVLSRGPSLSAQREPFASILRGAPPLKAVIYNSHYYGFPRKADLFFDLKKEISKI